MPEEARTDEQAVEALETAALLCRLRRQRLTPVRRRVLEMLWQADRPMGAYDLLSRLGSALGRRLAPPTVYRALGFLVEQGLVARLESRNAYVPCAHPDRPHACVFFVCNGCSHSIEIEDPAMEASIDNDAAALGFRIDRRILELQGTCARCQQGGLP